MKTITEYLKFFGFDIWVLMIEMIGELSTAELILLIIAVIIFLVIFCYLLRQWCQGGSFKKNTRIDGKVVIITGANSGLGKETAIDLAKRGGKIYMACRDLKRGEEALQEVKERSGSKNIHLLQLDLSSFKSIRDFSKKFHDKEKRLDILMNNAGIMACPKSLTEDGFESQFGVNHLGHFLLTNLLLDLLKKSAPSRIVNLSSIVHVFGRINKKDLNGDQFYNSWFAYAQSKLANILFTRELARRLKGTGVTANSLHPGLVYTGLHKHMYSLTRFLSLRPLIFKTPLNGAQTQIMLAVDPDLQKVSGKYFADCRKTFTSWSAMNDVTAAWLWDKSLELTKLKL